VGNRLAIHKDWQKKGLHWKIQNDYAVYFTARGYLQDLTFTINPYFVKANEHNGTKPWKKVEI
jgi:hypothetical protein